MGWNVKKLALLCSQDKQKSDDPNLPYLGLEDIESNTGNILQNENQEKVKSTTYCFNGKHVLYGRLRPYLNKVATPNYRGRCSTEIIPLLPKEDIDRNFLAFALRRKSVADYVMQKNTGARMPRADLNVLMQLEIPAPSLAEQKRIVEILKRAEGVIRLRKEQLAKTRALIPALFIDMFGDPATNPKGWQTVSFGDLIDDIRNGYNPKKEQFGKGTLFVTVNNLYDGLRIDIRNLDKAEITQKEIEKYRLYEGDLCFVRSSVKRDGVGMCAVYSDKSTAIFGGFVIRTKLHQSVNPYFICSLFHTRTMRKRIVDNAGTGTITNINQPALKRLPVILPPFDLQNNFLKQAESIEILIRHVEQSLTKQEEMFQSLLHHAFQGTLTPTVLEEAAE